MTNSLLMQAVLVRSFKICETQRQDDGIGTSSRWVKAHKIRE